MLWLLPGMLWTVVIFILSVMPSKELPVCQLFGFLPLDKVGHFVCYGILVFLFLPLIQRQYGKGKSRFTAEMALIGIATGYGIAIEYVQRLPIVNRSFDVNDMLADALGCFCGYIVYRVISAWVLAAARQPL